MLSYFGKPEFIIDPTRLSAYRGSTIRLRKVMEARWIWRPPYGHKHMPVSITVEKRKGKGASKTVTSKIRKRKYSDGGAVATPKKVELYE